MGGKKSNKKWKKLSLAKRADRHRLYELSVQEPSWEVKFIDATFKQIRGRKPRLLREDFCGTAAVCCEWARRRKTNRAIGVDIDGEVLDWGRRHNLSRLSPDRSANVELRQENVLDVDTDAPDVIAAMNFSYWLFKDRRDLTRYFRRVRDALADDGILFMDCYGGYDSFREIEEDRQVEDDKGRNFTYIWEQEKYEPISGNLICHIHFTFPDGSRLKRAFSYDWRLWTLPEIRDLLDEAGFSRVTAYWQGFDEDGEPDGLFEPVAEGDADAGWICYLTAEK